MEKFKSFEDTAREQKCRIEPWCPSEEFIKDYQSYMAESIRQSQKMHAEAIRTSRDIMIF